MKGISFTSFLPRIPEEDPLPKKKETKEQRVARSKAAWFGIVGLTK